MQLPLAVLLRDTQCIVKFGCLEMPEMPGLAQPVYEVKGTRLSPSSGAYEAPVTGTHWANDGFERRVRARCAAPQVLLTCHRCSTQPKSIRMCEGNRRRAAKEGTDGSRDGRSCHCFALLKVAAYQAGCHLTSSTCSLGQSLIW